MLYSMVVHCTVNSHMCLSGIQPPSRAQQRLDSLNLKQVTKLSSITLCIGTLLVDIYLMHLKAAAVENS